MLDAADRLEALERLERIQDMVAGSGLLKRYEAERLCGRLERRARGGVRSPEQVATTELLNSMGIEVVTDGPGSR